MTFIEFLYLLIIVVVVTVVLRYLPKVKIQLPGGIITNIIVGYIGAKLGVIMFGDWPFLTFEGISILPAILGAIVAIILANACVECCKDKSKNKNKK